MKLQAILHTSVNRGDHRAGVVQGVQITDETTIGELKAYFKLATDYINLVPVRKLQNE